MNTPKLGRTKGEREFILKDIISKYEQGLSLEEIAGYYNVTKQAISLKMKKAGYYPSKEAKRIKQEKISENLNKNTLEEIKQLKKDIKYYKTYNSTLRSIINKENKDNIQTYTQLINHFGERSQVIVAIEELSELQKELCKYLRGDKDILNITEEMADVEIMIEQLKIIFHNVKAVEEEKAFKIQRTKERYLQTNQ